jgi:hypothetical protein
MVQNAAVESLAMRKDPMALETLIDIARTPKKSYRAESFNLLANCYPQDPRVRPILRKAVIDRDPSIQFMAKCALKELDEKNH